MINNELTFPIATISITYLGLPLSGRKVRGTLAAGEEDGRKVNPLEGLPSVAWREVGPHPSCPLSHAHPPLDGDGASPLGPKQNKLHHA